MPDGASLERAGLYRLLAELFVDAPDPQLLELADTVPALAGLASGDLRRRYTRVFVLNAYPFGSVYLSPDGSVGGEHAGFTRGVLDALGLSVEDGLAPDHVSALFGALSALLEREAAAGPGVHAERARHAQRILLAEHLLPWVPHFLDAVERLDDGLYAAAAAASRALLRDHARTLFQGRRPGADAATDAPASDTAGGSDGRDRAGGPAWRSPSIAAFGGEPEPDAQDTLLAGLTRPARCGFFLARADVTAIAAALELPLRFGGRRFMLESLAQAAAQAGAGEPLSGALTRFAGERRKVLDAWCASLPQLARPWEAAAERLDAAVAALRRGAADPSIAVRPGAPEVPA